MKRLVNHIANANLNIKYCFIAFLLGYFQRLNLGGVNINNRDVSCRRLDSRNNSFLSRFPLISADLIVRESRAAQDPGADRLELPLGRLGNLDIDQIAG